MAVKTKPLCANCAHCVQGEPRRVPHFIRRPVFHPNLFCSREELLYDDFVLGETVMPFCEEKNGRGECVYYETRPASVPVIEFDPETREASISNEAGDPMMFSFDGEDFRPYESPLKIEETTTVYAYSTFGKTAVDGVEADNVSETVSLLCEVEPGSGDNGDGDDGDGGADTGEPGGGD